MRRRARPFESGAIVLHVAERSEALMPSDPQPRARHAVDVRRAQLDRAADPEPAEIDLFYPSEDGPGAPAGGGRGGPAAARRTRRCLDGRDYLEDRFTAADLLMTTVLRILRHTDLVASGRRSRPIAALRGAPGLQKALADQMAAFAENAPPDRRARGMRCAGRGGVRAPADPARTDAQRTLPARFA